MNPRRSIAIAALVCALFVDGERRERGSAGVLSSLPGVSAAVSAAAVEELSPPVIEKTGSVENDEHVLVARRRPSWILRGDWETPDLVFVVYEEEWRESLETIIDGIGNIAEVVVVADTDTLRDVEFQQWLGLNDVSVVSAEYDTPWIRDYGPLQGVDGGNRVSWFDLGYAPDRPADDGVPVQLGRSFGIPVLPAPFYLEGGGLIGNGRGLCAMTELTFAEASVDPGDQESTDRFLGSLGCRVLALLPALVDEDTGHVDMVAQFASPDTVLLAFAVSGSDPGIVADLEQSMKTLQAATRILGQPLNVVRVPMTVSGPIFYSYVNGTRIGNRFLTPHFDGVPPDVEEDAYRRLSRAMPGVELLPIPSDRILASGGVVHCVTLGLNLPPEKLLARHKIRRRVRQGPGHWRSGRNLRS